MKVVFLTKVVPPTINGVGEYCVRLASALREQNIEVHILTSSDQKAVEPWIHPQIKAWNVDVISESLKSFNADWVFLQYVPQLYSRNGVCGAIAVLMSRLRKILGCKTGVIFHEFQSAWGKTPKTWLLALILRIQTLKLLSGSDLNITTCESYRRILNRYPIHHKRVECLPVGATCLPSKNSEAKVDELRARLGFLKTRVISVFGRLSNFRRVELALNLLEVSRNRGLEVCLLLIGALRNSQPGLFADLMSKAKRKNLEPYILETGELSESDISLYLSITDIFIFPQVDGVSTRNTTLMSALAHGLPIIAFKPRRGNFEGFDLPWGAFSDPKSEQGFIESALQFISQPTDLHLRKLQQDYFYKNFAWDIISKKFALLLRDYK